MPVLGSSVLQTTSVQGVLMLGSKVSLKSCELNQERLFRHSTQIRPLINSPLSLEKCSLHRRTLPGLPVHTRRLIQSPLVSIHFI